jgi:catechol 2,3-dioxygenase-like lactoylglutathione lyase family enzyme
MVEGQESALRFYTSVLGFELVLEPLGFPPARASTIIEVATEDQYLGLSGSDLGRYFES